MKSNKQNINKVEKKIKIEVPFNFSRIIRIIGLIAGLITIYWFGEYCGSKSKERIIVQISNESNNFKDELQWYKEYLPFLERKTDSLGHIIPVAFKLTTLPTHKIGIHNGKIVDSKGNPLVQASVSIEGGPITASDKNGYFNIRCNIGARLYITKDGYRGQEINITKQNKFLYIRLERNNK